MGKKFLFCRSWRRKQKQKFRKRTESEKKKANLEGSAYLNKEVKRPKESKNTCDGGGWTA